MIQQLRCESKIESILCVSFFHPVEGDVKEAMGGVVRVVRGSWKWRVEESSSCSMPVMVFNSYTVKAVKAIKPLKEFAN
jgi:hypothetical protein